MTDTPPSARARALAPLIEAAAGRTEAGTEIPPDLLAALHDARLFRTLLPRPSAVTKPRRPNSSA